jgi:glucosamine--fructose-6-phosphate aminotransferase (isomerizing)
MFKEIYEQPNAVAATLAGRVVNGVLNMAASPFTAYEAKQISRIELLACGTSWHAALVGSYWIEQLTRIPCHATVASEFRYRDPALDRNVLAVAISQSGETADTLAALRQCKQSNTMVLAIANVAGSTLIREAGRSLLTRCGSEIGVASTKAFMGQLVALYLLALYLGAHRQAVGSDVLGRWTRELSSLPDKIAEALACEPQVRRIAARFQDRAHFLFLGRHLNFPIALEGALKLKEISYIHAEGYPAGEMKHGPIALIDAKMPVVALVTASHVYDKMFSNLEEVRSRHGEIISIATRGDKRIAAKSSEVVFLPEAPEELGPMLNVIPLQLLAYHVAVLRGCDVDQPRNLAKSVTVE